MNSLETLSLLVSISVSYCGMYYVTGAYYVYLDETSPIKWLFLCIIFVSFVGYNCYWLTFVLIELIFSISTTSEKAFRILTLDQISPEDFRRKFMGPELGAEEDCPSEVCLSAADPEDIQIEAIIDKESTEEIAPTVKMPIFKAESYDLLKNHGFENSDILKERQKALRILIERHKSGSASASSPRKPAKGTSSRSAEQQKRASRRE